MRKSQQLVLGGLLGAALFWLFAKFGDASAKREAAAHGRTYVEDTPSKIVWVGLGAFSGVLIVTARPVFRFAGRHPKALGMLSLSVVIGGLYKMIEYLAAAADAVDMADDQSGGKGMAESPSFRSHGGFRPTSDGPLGLDVFADLGGRGRRCRDREVSGSGS